MIVMFTNDPKHDKQVIDWLFTEVFDDEHKAKAKDFLMRLALDQWDKEKNQ